MRWAVRSHGNSRPRRSFRVGPDHKPKPQVGIEVGAAFMNPSRKSFRLIDHSSRVNPVFDK